MASPITLTSEDEDTGSPSLPPLPDQLRPFASLLSPHHPSSATSLQTPSPSGSAPSPVIRRPRPRRSSNPDHLSTLTGLLDSIISLSSDLVKNGSQEEKRSALQELHNSPAIAHISKAIKYLSSPPAPLQSPAAPGPPPSLAQITARGPLHQRHSPRTGPRTVPNPLLSSFSASNYVKYAIYIKFLSYQPVSLTDIFTKATSSLHLSAFKTTDDTVSLYVPLLNREMTQQAYDALLAYEHKSADGTRRPLTEICAVVRIIKSPYAIKCTRNDPALFSHWFHGTAIDYKIAKTDLVNFNSSTWFPSPDLIREIESFYSVTNGETDTSLLTIKLHLQESTYRQFLLADNPFICLNGRDLKVKVEVEVDSCDSCLLTAHDGPCTVGPNCAFCSGPHASASCTNKWKKQCYNCNLLNQALLNNTVRLRWYKYPIRTDHYANSGLCTSLIIEKDNRRDALKRLYSSSTLDTTASSLPNATNANNLTDRHEQD